MLPTNTNQEYMNAWSGDIKTDAEEPLAEKQDGDATLLAAGDGISTQTHQGMLENGVEPDDAKQKAYDARHAPVVNNKPLYKPEPHAEKPKMRNEQGLRDILKHRGIVDAKEQDDFISDYKKSNGLKI